MLEYVISHPLYIPFIIFNAFIIYKIIKTVLGNDKGKNDDDEDGGIFGNDHPILDLPPGVTLPLAPKEPVLND
jgi:hypothetical protein